MTLQALNEISDEVFVRHMRNTTLTNVEAALHLRVSIPTVRRWRNGRSLPAQALRRGYARKIIVESLFKELDKEYPRKPNEDLLEAAKQYNQNVEPHNKSVIPQGEAN